MYMPFAQVVVLYSSVLNVCMHVLGHADEKGIEKGISCTSSLHESILELAEWIPALETPG